MQNSVNSQSALIYIAKNDTAEADSKITRYVGTQNVTGAGATQAIISLATNDTVRLMVDITAGTTPDITITDYKLTITSVSNN